MEYLDLNASFSSTESSPVFASPDATPPILGAKKIAQPYCFFRDDIDHREYDKMMAGPFSGFSENNYTHAERLQCFRDLTNFLTEEHQDKRSLMLLGDMRSGVWTYVFWLGDKSLYAHEVPITEEALAGWNEKDLDDYQTEYFRLLLTSATDAATFDGAMQAVRDISTNQALSHEERLHSFLELKRLASPQDADLFSIDVRSLKSENRWNYSLDVDGVTLYESGRLGIEDGKTLTKFQYLHYLGKLRLELLSKQDRPYTAPELQGTIMQFFTPDFGVEVALLENLELPLVVVADQFHRNVSITVDNEYFRLEVDGQPLSGKEIPFQPSYGGMTPHVQITMSALRLSLLRHKVTFHTIIKEFDAYRSTHSQPNEAAVLTLREALSDDAVKGRRITITQTGDPKVFSTFSLSVQGALSPRTFVVSENDKSGKALNAKSISDANSSAERDAANKRRVLRGLCTATFFDDVYLSAKHRMTKDELIIFQAKIHTIFLDDFSLGDLSAGQLFGIYRPTREEVLQASGGFDIFS